jgi:hypothetical protein
MDESAWVSKLEDRQRASGEVWADVMRYALRLKRVEVEPGALRVNWKSAAPLSTQDQLEEALGMQALGFPLSFIMKKVYGYEPDQIAEVLEAKRREVDEGARAFNRGMIAPPVDDEEDAA